VCRALRLSARANTPVQVFRFVIRDTVEHLLYQVFQLYETTATNALAQGSACSTHARLGHESNDRQQALRDLICRILSEVSVTKPYSALGLAISE
jgi:hypothetical protein